jgi:hypothetical protein
MHSDPTVSGMLSSGRLTSGAAVRAISATPERAGLFTRQCIGSDRVFDGWSAFLPWFDRNFASRDFAANRQRIRRKTLLSARGRVD